MAKVEMYDNLDAPIIVWEKVNRTGDLSQLLIKKVKVDEKIERQLMDAWEKISNEFVDEFGFSDTFLAMKKKEIEIALLQCKLVETDDRSIETDIEIAEIELESIRKEISGTHFRDAKIAIEKTMKFQINMNTTSIRDFYQYLKELN